MPRVRTKNYLASAVGCLLGFVVGALGGGFGYLILFRPHGGFEVVAIFAVAAAIGSVLGLTGGVAIALRLVDADAGIRTALLTALFVFLAALAMTVLAQAPRAGGVIVAEEGFMFVHVFTLIACPVGARALVEHFRQPR